MVLHGRRTRGTDVYADPRVLARMWRAHPHVVVSPAFSVPTACAAVYKRLAGSRLMIYSDGTALTESTLGRGHALARRVLIHRADACIGLSAEAVRRFEQLGCPHERAFCVPHAARLDGFRAAGAHRETPPPATLRVLAVSRFIPRKGIDQLTSAIAIARLSEPGIRLDLVGAGPDERRLRALAERSASRAVRFHGFVDQAELPAFHRRADVFALPSRRDEFGIAALEAAAAGMPLVASPHAGATTDLVEDGRSGFIVDPGDPAAMAERFVRLAREPAMRLSMGRAAAERSRRHEPTIAAQGYVRAVHRVLADASDRSR